MRDTRSRAAQPNVIDHYENGQHTLHDRELNREAEGDVAVARRGERDE